MVNRVDRAKQFLSFDALKGLKEALQEKEELASRENKHILSEERVLELNEILLTINNGDVCFVKYYSYGKYLTITGYVKIMKNVKQLKINDIIINFEDIYDIYKTAF